MGLPNVPTLYYHLDVAIYYSNLPVFQSELKKKCRMRAILQTIALPSKSVQKNIAEAEKQFQSKPSLLLPPSYQLQIYHQYQDVMSQWQLDPEMWQGLCEK